MEAKSKSSADAKQTNEDFIKDIRRKTRKLSLPNKRSLLSWRPSVVSPLWGWYHAYLQKGAEGLQPVAKPSRRQWSTILEEQKNLVVTVALEFADLSSCELAVKLTKVNSAYLSRKAACTAS